MIWRVSRILSAYILAGAFCASAQITGTRPQEGAIIPHGVAVPQVVVQPAQPSTPPANTTSSAPPAATSQPRILTVVSAQLGVGIVVVDQRTGAISYCSDEIGETVTGSTFSQPKPLSHCAKLGTITPTSTPPAAAVGLTVIIPAGTDVTVKGNATGGTSFYVINNQTGDIVQCSTVNGNTPTGTCVDLGIVPE